MEKLSKEDQKLYLDISQEYLIKLQYKTIAEVITIQKQQEQDNLINNFNTKEASNVLLDFSNMFKKKPRTKKKAQAPQRLQKLQNNAQNNENQEIDNKENIDNKQETMIDEDDPSKIDGDKNVIIVEQKIIDNEIPRNLTITQEDMKQRRYLDQRRWFCLSRCQYKRSCGISSLVSVWNYLFSTLGTGDLPPLSQEEALIQLGVCKERDRYFGDVEFGAFTGNGTLIKWFRLLCKIYKVQGRAFIMWKHSGESKTPGVDQDLALQKLQEGLKTETNGFIYHAQDHYFCPMGFELTTQRPMDAYKKMEDIDPNEIQPWIFIGEPSKCYPCFHIKKWSEIVKDLTMGNPYYYNIRRPDKGVMERKGAIFQTGKKMGTTINCLIQFQKVVKINKNQQVQEEIKPKIIEEQQVLQEKVDLQNLYN